MKTVSLALITLSAAALSLAACTKEDKVLAKPPGTYQSNTSSTNAAGTTTNRTTYTDVSVDANGKKRAVVKKKVTKDPQGLFNKETTNDTEEVIRER